MLGGKRKFSIVGISLLSIILLSGAGFAFEDAFVDTINLNDSISCLNIAGGSGFTWVDSTCTLTNQPNTLVFQRE